MYIRRTKALDTRPVDDHVVDCEKDDEQSVRQIESRARESDPEISQRRTYRQQLSVFDKTDPESPVFLMMVTLPLPCSSWPARAVILR